MESISLIILITSLWFIRQIKVALFWFYLWQLKEYHIARFFDHFRTDKGKRLFLNWLFISKIGLLSYALLLSFYSELLPWYFYAGWIFILIILYLFESIKFFIDIIQKRTKKPILTQKTLTLISVNLILVILFAFLLGKKTNFIYWFSFGLLSFDILSPFLISGIVLLFQPLTVLLRNRVIKRAKEKRERFKDLPRTFCKLSKDNGETTKYFSWSNGQKARGLLVIGITGSYGKTSTKEFLAAILEEKLGKDELLKTKGHQNSEIGISQCILNDLKPEHQIFVVEMAAYNKGGIRLACDITKPKIGIITGVNEQHMATYGSQENIIHAKFELIQALPKDGLAVLNGSDPKIKNEKLKIKNYNPKLKNIKFSSINEKADIWAENINIGKESLSFRVFSANGDFSDFRLNLLGAQNVENILLAACCAKELGMSLKEISLACQKLKPFSHQMELKKGINGLNIIDDTYSANPDAVVAHLEYLKVWPGRKIIVMPCLIELGKASKEAHKRIGKKISEVCDLAIITTKERFKEINENAGDKAVFLENTREILEKIKSFCQSDDAILLQSRVPSELIEQLIINN